MSRIVAIEEFRALELEFFTYGDGSQGPSVLITAGVHGGEATGIWAARQIMQKLQAQELKGQVTVLPVANPAAFRRGTRTSPFDGIDMNRIFPGKPEGEPTLVTANTIWQEAKKADFIVDLHCCGIFGSDYTLALWQEFDFARDLASKLDIPVVIESGGTRNQLFVEACHASIPAVIVELAGGQFGSEGGLLDRPSGERAVTAVWNLLKRLGVAPGEAPAISPAFYGKLREVNSDRAALWSPAVQPGAQVQEGQMLGDLDGAKVASTATGVATAVCGPAYVFPGRMLAMVAPRA